MDTLDTSGVTKPQVHSQPVSSLLPSVGVTGSRCHGKPSDLLCPGSLALCPGSTGQSSRLRSLMRARIRYGARHLSLIISGPGLIVSGWLPIATHCLLHARFTKRAAHTSDAISYRYWNMVRLKIWKEQILNQAEQKSTLLPPSPILGCGKPLLPSLLS